MLISKKKRLEVYKFLFREGVCYAEAKKDLPKHPEMDVSNLHVIKIMQSLTTKNYVTESFAWRHHYWFLTQEGVSYMREYFALTSASVPATFGKMSQHALSENKSDLLAKEKSVR